MVADIKELLQSANIRDNIRTMRKDIKRLRGIGSVEENEKIANPKTTEIKKEIKPAEQFPQLIKQQKTEIQKTEMPKIPETKLVENKTQERNALISQPSTKVKNDLSVPISNETKTEGKKTASMKEYLAPAESMINKTDQAEEQKRKFIEDVERWASYSDKNE